METRFAILLMLVPAGALAGCVGGESAFVTATTQLETALDEATAWSSNATLVQVQGVDPAQAPPDEADEDDIALAWRADPVIGDGRSQAWGYLFTAPDREAAYHVVVAANGTVRKATEVTEDSDGAFVLEPDVGPVRDWEVDSDEAADIVADANATWPDGPPGALPMLSFSFLWGQQNASAFWVMGLQTTEGEQTHFVNATSGEYLGTEVPGNESLYELEPRDGPPHEGGRFNGTVSVQEPQADHTFTIEREGHPVLAVELVIPADAGGTLNLTVLDPEGELAQHTQIGGNAGGSGGAVVTLGGPATGDWTARVTLEDGAVQRYRVDWCAADNPPGAVAGGFEASDPPCGENPDEPAR